MPGIRQSFSLVIACLLYGAFAQDQSALAEDSSRVVAVTDGDTLVLDDGRRARLAGIDAPRAPLGLPRETPWRQQEAARAGLSELAVGRTVMLRAGDAPLDRYGRTLAQVYRDDGLWLQAEMLRRGLARVHSYADNRAFVPELLIIENEARTARRGLWRDAAYAVRRPEEMGRFVDSFQLVEGTIVDVAKVKGQVFLNFALEWRTAFTAHLPRSALPLFRASGVDPLSLKGVRVRLRGWVYYDRRPMIDVTHPEQIEH